MLGYTPRGTWSDPSSGAWAVFAVTSCPPFCCLCYWTIIGYMRSSGAFSCLGGVCFLLSLNLGVRHVQTLASVLVQLSKVLFIVKEGTHHFLYHL